MAETITYRVLIEPRAATVSSTELQNGSVDEVILTAAQAASLRALFDEIKAGTDVSAVFTAIDAL
jgi:hypothetical protein